MLLEGMDSAVCCCTICKDANTVAANSFQFPNLKPFQITLPALPEIPTLTSENWISEPHDFDGKIKTRRRMFKPVLARIFENDYNPTVNNELNEKEMKYFSMFDRHKTDDVIYEDNSMRITSSNKSRWLCDAVFRNDVEFVNRLINLGISPNCFDRHKRTPLHIAVSKGHSEMVKLLLDRGADPNVKDGLGNSSLHLAACTNNVEVSLILIRGGASVHAVDIRGRSPIELAQSKLRLLSQYPDGYIKSNVKQVIDMLLLYLAKNNERENNEGNTTLLTTFQSRLQVTNTPEQISNELDNLSKILNQMESLTIDNK